MPSQLTVCKIHTHVGMSLPVALIDESGELIGYLI